MNGQQHMAAVSALGCIVCRREGKGPTPADAHHLLRGGKKIGDKATIPLCVWHHRSGIKTPEIVSRHPWKKEFEKRYGTESELLELTLAELEKVRGGA